MIGKEGSEAHTSLGYLELSQDRVKTIERGGPVCDKNAEDNAIIVKGAPMLFAIWGRAVPAKAEDWTEGMASLYAHKLSHL